MTDENKDQGFTPPAFAIEEDEEEETVEEKPKSLPPEAALYAMSANIIWGDLQLIQGAVNKMIVQVDVDEGSLPSTDQYYVDVDDLDDIDPTADERAAMVLEDVEATARAVQSWAKKVADRAANLRSLVMHRVKAPTNS